MIMEPKTFYIEIYSTEHHGAGNARLERGPGTIPGSEKYKAIDCPFIYADGEFNVYWCEFGMIGITDRAPSPKLKFTHRDQFGQNWNDICGNFALQIEKANPLIGKASS